jgi:hypothetical protein
MQDKSDIKIVSLIPNKSKEIIEKYIWNCI